MIGGRVDRHVDRHVNRRVDRRVDKRVDRRIDKRMVYFTGRVSGFVAYPLQVDSGVTMEDVITTRLICLLSVGVLSEEHLSVKRSLRLADSIKELYQPFLF